MISSLEGLQAQVFLIVLDFVWRTFLDHLHKCFDMIIGIAFNIYLKPS